ncbi:PTS sugar transporter subunit IIA [Lamprobacter modestohalophilus]|uniref:PTS sugar transporter subunit IIA n=1 Tax=Lamprobacter modestohalophilus TaxID=1064514 RepID=A0A9X1B382_9GAMM|nr:PTS sugar transporter subunit IIA [Lamprobacter modestohalophilus]MCF7979491.1 PTS sugar transporter subunit IIA [Chromatiaceae bacterium]MBK1617684.1 PTS sugar transporter subunit IIA [Lamprobacter modestohalophilus]MCF7994225.1 PTS sugar transporter subunit IIA [Chromatiaceae bacterium]MCF8003180.1 PTS sugar transporter subunit IIA [Chromatiaceae bacterium]MCF8016185.1 PTS sugar transporter subunit IIA [Chromatiaceae bacterium]
MFPPSLIAEPRIRCRVEVTSKKRLLESLAELLATARPDCPPASVFDLLNERERLGSTGLGEGIALPHARIEGIDNAVGAFVQLSEGVSFDAPDDQPVDLAFGLLVPQEATDAHLNLLAQLAERFSDPQLRSALRAANDASIVLDVLQRRD